MKLRKKMLLLTVSQCLLGVLLFSGCGKSAKDNSVTEVEALTYEILDDTVLADETLQSWLNDNLSKDGLFTTESEDSTYVLISAGEQSEPGCGISLSDVDTSSNPVKVTYQIFEPTTNNPTDGEDETVSTIEYEQVSVDENGEVVVQEIDDSSQIESIENTTTQNTTTPHMILRFKGTVKVKGILQ